MSLIVQKFGGSSLADYQCMRHVVSCIKNTQDHSKVVVVVSAMQGETQQLIAMAQSMAIQPDLKAYDMLLATAEQKSAALLSMILIQEGVSAVALTGGQAGIITNNSHKQASIDHIDTDSIMQYFSTSNVVIVTGFQGVSMTSGATTTLGRGGSDLTAIALASALNADECLIYTDVAGVYTADPRYISHARVINKLSIQDMLALSAAGAKVMQEQALHYALHSRIAFRVLSTFDDGQGTLVYPEYQISSIEKKERVIGVALKDQLAVFRLINVINVEKVIASLYEKMKTAAIPMIDIIKYDNKMTSDVVFFVPIDDSQQALLISNELADTFQIGNIIHQGNSQLITIVGCNMQRAQQLVSNIQAMIDDSDLVTVGILSASEKGIVVYAEKAELKQLYVMLYQLAFAHKGAINSVSIESFCSD